MHKAHGPSLFSTSPFASGSANASCGVNITGQHLPGAPCLGLALGTFPTSPRPDGLPQEQKQTKQQPPGWIPLPLSAYTNAFYLKIMSAPHFHFRGCRGVSRRPAFEGRAHGGPAGCSACWAAGCTHGEARQAGPPAQARSCVPIVPLAETPCASVTERCWLLEDGTHFSPGLSHPDHLAVYTHPLTRATTPGTADLRPARCRANSTPAQPHWAAGSENTCAPPTGSPTGTLG